LRAEIEHEARSAPFDVCHETYEAAGRDPDVPILCAGNLAAPVCAVGRELGRDEVLRGEPLIGMGGRRFRRAAHEALFGPAPRGEREFRGVLDHVLLTNLVPYRPVKNKAYDKRTQERFRPFVERLLAEHWQGDRVLALGKTSFLWFARYREDGAVAAAWADRDARFDVTLPIAIRGRALSLAVLPHPSPLSPFKAQFAELLQRRLAP
jgi:uracil-DNA glycosylase